MNFHDTDFGPSASRTSPNPIRNNVDPRGLSGADNSNANHDHHGPPAPSFLGTGADRRKRTSTSTDPFEVEVRPKDIRRGARTKDKTAQRAAQACLRCRRQKLRCLGGNPCERCVRTSNVCDFGLPGGQPGGKAVQDACDVNSIGAIPAPIVAQEAATIQDEGRDERLKHLESSVVNLLAGLAEEPDLIGQGYPHLEIFHEVVKHRKEPSRSTPSLSSSTATRLPPPTHVRPLDPIRFGTAPSNPLISPTSTHQRYQSISPAILVDTSPPEPSHKASHSLDAMLNRPAETRAGREGGLPYPGTESLYEAPFRSLVRHVSHVSC